MQSDRKPVIEFSLVPKMLLPLANIWAPNAFIVSFKLETDEDLLLPKALQALEKYQHDVSIVLTWTLNRVRHEWWFIYEDDILYEM